MTASRPGVVRDPVTFFSIRRAGPMGISAAIVVVVCVTGAVTWASRAPAAIPPGVRVDRVVVHKAERRLDVYAGGVLVASYPVSLGRHPVGPKQQEGDGRTPEGVYRLDYRKADSAYHRALHISYPSADDARTAQARGVTPGGAVMIHGMRNGFGWIGRLHRFVDWTNGCVAMTDAEMDQLWAAVPDGTVVELVP